MATDGVRDSGAPGRQALLEAAVRVVAAKGLDGVSYRSVAREAGVTPGLVFYHFGSRESLILEAALMAGRRAVTAALPKIEGGELDTFLSELPVTAENDLADHLFQYEMAFNVRRRPELASEMRELYALYSGETQNALLSLGFDRVSPAFARLIFAMIDGLVLQQVIFADPVRTERSVATLREVLRRLAGQEA